VSGRSAAGPVAAGVLVALSLLLVVGLAVAGGSDDGSTSSAVVTVTALATDRCAISGPVHGLSPQQAANAEVVVSVAMTVSGYDKRAARIVLVAALVESGLENLDRGSGRFGLFQLRPGRWGTASQLMEPSYAAAAFTQHLLALPAWRARPPWAAAQAVEGAVPSEEGRFRQAWRRARKLLAGVLAKAQAPGGCGQGVGSPAGAGHGLPPGYVVPAGTPPLHAAVVRFALAQLGRPYVWGGAGPAAYDCSGLTMAAWASVGVALVHAASLQQSAGVEVTASALVPGDLVLVPGTDSPGPGLAGHVGIYLGDGLVLSAIDTEYGVAIQSWASFVSGGLIALRDPAPGL
jgi:cell wall-associated NlpC family hydrolase